MVQAVPLQHAPVGWGQMFGVHEPPLVQAPPVQADCGPLVQVPAGTQQDPDGCEQMFGVQFPPLVQVPDVQAA